MKESNSAQSISPGISIDDWDEHWSKFGASAEQGPSLGYRRRLVLQGLNLEGQGEKTKLLEIGSGTGEFAEVVCGDYPRVKYLGLDLSRVGVEVSGRRVPQARFLQRDLLQSKGTEEGLDFGATHAVCSEVLEHLDNPELLLRNAAAYMQKGCKLVVTVPGGGMNAFYKHIGHRRHYSSKEMSELLQRSGFRVEKAYDAGFPFFNTLRLFLTWRGDKMIETLSGPPSGFARFGMKIFDVLFRFNLMRWGWQTVVVASYGA
jgi:SAM-dependent methyltransferase